MRWVGHAVRMEEMTNVYKFLIRKPEGKKSLGRHSRRREDNIKMEGKGKGKGKFIPVLLLTEHHAMRCTGGVEV
jgi:hypothetical protein